MNGTPLVILLEETKQKILNVINEQNLPPCLIEPILKELCNEASLSKQTEYQIALENIRSNKAGEANG